jgi:hypothetical protein
VALLLFALPERLDLDRGFPWAKWLFVDELALVQLVALILFSSSSDTKR